MTSATIEKRERRTRRRRRIRVKRLGDGRAPAAVGVPLQPRRRRASWSTTSGATRSHRCGGSRPDLRDLKPMEQANRAGELLAERAKEAGVESCVFDRGGYKYHGRVKALADGARSSGLRF